MHRWSHRVSLLLFAVLPLTVLFLSGCAAGKGTGPISIDILAIVLLLFLAGCLFLYLKNRRLASDLNTFRQTEAQLHESAARYNSFFERNRTTMILVDASTGKLVDANPAACAYFGVSLDEFRRLRIHDMIDLPHERVDTALCQTTENGMDHFFVPIHLANGEKRQTEVHSAVINVQGGHLLYVIVHDITLQRQAQLALEKNERIMAALMSNLPGMVFSLRNDEAFTMEFASEGAQELTGYSPSDLVQNYSISYASLIHPADRRNVLSAQEKAIRQSKPYQCVYRIRTAQGAEKWVDEHGRGIFDEEGHFLSLEGFITDITENKWAETIQSVIYNISLASNTSADLESLLVTIHQELGRLMNVTNFFVALYDERTELYTFPYAIDEYDPVDSFTPQQMRNSLTDYVRRAGIPCLIDEHLQEQLTSENIVDVVGTLSPIWLGVPLRTPTKTIGVIVLQDYHNATTYTIKDVETLSLVSENIALAISRKQAETEVTRLATVMNQANEGVVLAAVSGEIIYINPCFERMSGYTLADLVGKDLYTTLNQITSSSISADMRQPLIRGGTWRDRRTAQQKNGNRFELDLLAYPVRDDDGDIINHALICKDITAEIQRQRELEAVVAVVSALRHAQTRAETTAAVLDQLITLLGAQGAALTMMDEKRGGMMVSMGRGDWARWTQEHIPMGDPVVEFVQRSGQLYFSNDIYANSSPTRPDLIGTNQALVCAPLIVNEQVIGALWAGGQTPFEEADRRMLIAISDITASEINREMLFEQTQLRMRRLSSLRAIDMAISSSLDLHLTLGILLTQVTTQLNVDAADVLLLNPYTRILDYVAGRGFRTDAITRTHLHLGESYAGRAALDRRVAYIPQIKLDDAHRTRTDLLADEGFVSYYAVPLIAKGQVNGVLEIYQRSLLDPDAEWLSFLDALALQAAIAINNADLFENLQKSHNELAFAYDETLSGWVHFMDMRAREGEKHTERVVNLTVRVARAMNVSDADLVNIRRGALLHDIGKMSVPDHILQKTDPLTAEEIDEMHRHPLYAYQLLSPINYLRPAVDIPYCHHERWDGSGYPRGLKNEQIPFAARIFAAVDVYTALITPQSAQPAQDPSRAVAYLRSKAGILFDPAVVSTLIDVLDQGDDWDI